MNFAVVVLRILALILASFIFWKKLKEDYPNEEIFFLTILMLVSGNIGGRFFQAQGAFLGGILPLILFSKIKKWNPWQAADAVIYPFLLIFLILNFSKIIYVFSWLTLLMMTLGLGVLVSSLRIEKTYRSFLWYKSGKVGFLACFAILAFFGPFLLLEFFLKKELYWLLFTDFGILIITAIFLYYRSERKFAEDWQFFKKSILKK